MLPYDPQMRPVHVTANVTGRLHLDVAVGTQCPVCGKDVMAMVGPVVDQPDGSCTGRCDKCQAKLRMNPEGFVFLGA